MENKNYALEILENQHKYILEEIAESETRLARRNEEVSNLQERIVCQRKKAKHLAITIAFLEANSDK